MVGIKSTHKWLLFCCVCCLFIKISKLTLKGLMITPDGSEDIFRLKLISHLICFIPESGASLDRTKVSRSGHRQMGADERLDPRFEVRICGNLYHPSVRLVLMSRTRKNVAILRKYQLLVISQVALKINLLNLKLESQVRNKITLK